MWRYLLICFSLTVCSSAVAQDTAAEFFPAALGTKWTYKVSGGPKEVQFVIEANANERIGDETCTRFDARVGGKLATTEHLVARKDGLYRVALNGVTLNPPICVCKFPSKRGDKWTEKYKYNDMEAKFDFESDNDNVTTPAGAYKAVIVTGAANEKQQKVRVTTWYAPKVGMVKQVVEQGDMKVTIELEKFEAPKK